MRLVAFTLRKTSQSSKFVDMVMGETHLDLALPAMAACHFSALARGVKAHIGLLELTDV